MERYQRVFTLSDSQYLRGSPVIIAAGALLKDTSTGSMLAQLKFTSLSDAKITYLEVSVTGFDPSGKEVCSASHKYLDLTVKRGQDFGSREAVPMSDPSVRSFTVKVTRALLSDNNIWENGDFFTPLPKLEPLPEQYVQGFAYTFGTYTNKYLPLQTENLWFCACGAANRSAEEKCYRCGTSRDAILSTDPEACRKDNIYANAIESMNRSTFVKYSTKHLEEAIKLFSTISGWKDADEQIYACRKKLEEIKAKEEADRLERERQAEQKRIAAEKAAKKRKKIIAIATPIVVACIAFLIVLTTVIIPSGKYNSAMELYNVQKYEDAYKAFNSLNYKDSDDKAAECLFLKQKKVLTNVNVGSTIKFGFYEQDNNTSNGKEEIEWKVLAVEGNKALVISQYALDCQKYNSTYTDTTWEKCSLRTWLNSTFYNVAFGSDHQKMIESSTVTADNNPWYSTSPGNNTTDNVFLLSITEVNKYFSSDEARKCAPTDYAKAQGAYISYSTTGTRATGWWWLRSPGNNSSHAAYVSSSGSVYNNGNNVNRSVGAVRPALWINLESKLLKPIQNG